MRFIISVIFFFAFTNANAKHTYCFTDDGNPYDLFGSKTVYSNIRMTAGSDTDCKPIQLWFLNRHGTRFPSKSDIKKMKLSEQIQESVINQYNNTSEDVRLCKRDLEAIEKWSWDEYMENHPSYLNEQGWKDLYELAQRYKIRYPEILGQKYDPKYFYFRHTVCQRTEESCKAFIDGLFGNGAHEFVEIAPPIQENDDIKSYDFCRAWSVDVDKNDEAKKETLLFLESDLYKTIHSEVSQRLGFNYNLSDDEIYGLYSNCRFDKSRYPDKLSPWCSVFTKKHLQLLEYRNDIFDYYKSGHGHEYNSKLGCTPLLNLRNAFENTILLNSTIPAVTALFTHDTMINMVYSFLSYSKEPTDLTGMDIEDFLINRKTRASYNLAFATNIVAVLHECDSKSEEKYKVQFFANEKPMVLNGSDFGLFNWSYLENVLPKECDLDFCIL